MRMKGDSKRKPMLVVAFIVFTLAIGNFGKNIYLMSKFTHLSNDEVEFIDFPGLLTTEVSTKERIVEALNGCSYLGTSNRSKKELKKLTIEYSDGTEDVVVLSSVERSDKIRVSLQLDRLVVPVCYLDSMNPFYNAG